MWDGGQGIPMVRDAKSPGRKFGRRRPIVGVIFVDTWRLK